MVYVVELKTTQTSAVKILTDTLNSLLTDVNLNFYPFYLDDSVTENNSDSESEYESESEESEEENKEEENKKLVV